MPPINDPEVRLPRPPSNNDEKALAVNDRHYRSLTAEKHAEQHAGNAAKHTVEYSTPRVEHCSAQPKQNVTPYGSAITSCQCDVPTSTNLYLMRSRSLTSNTHTTITSEHADTSGRISGAPSADMTRTHIVDEAALYDYAFRESLVLALYWMKK